MTTFWMGFYVLIWPAMSAIVLFIIWTAFMKELKTAKSKGKSLV